MPHDEPQPLVRARVRAEAVRLFAAKGFAAVGIRELAQATGVSSATLYHYVGSKDELLVDVMRAGLLELRDLESRAVSAQQTPPAQLSAIVHVHVVAHAVAAQTCRVVDTELRSLHGDARAEVVALRDAVEQQWVDVVRTGTDTGWFRSPVPVHVTVRALLDMATGVAAWYRPDGPQRAEQLARQLADVALLAVDARQSTAAGAGRVRVDDLPASIARLWDLGVLVDPGRGSARRAAPATTTGDAQ